MNVTRRNTFPKAVLDRKLEIDGRVIDFREFLKVNNFYGHGQSKITPNQVRMVVDLEPGENIFINIVEVKRIT